MGIIKQLDYNFKDSVVVFRSYHTNGRVGRLVLKGSPKSIQRLVEQYKIRGYFIHNTNDPVYDKPLDSVNLQNL